MNQTRQHRGRARVTISGIGYNGRLLNAHTNACAKTLIAAGTLAQATHCHAIHVNAVIEAFPSSFLGLLVRDPQSLQIRRGNRSDRFYAHLSQSGILNDLLECLLPSRRLKTSFESVRHHDETAAVTCALTALCAAAGNYTAVGDKNGWIVLPPASFIEPLAWRLLTENAQEGEIGWCGSSPHSAGG